MALLNNRLIFVTRRFCISLSFCILIPVVVPPVMLSAYLTLHQEVQNSSRWSKALHWSWWSQTSLHLEFNQETYLNVTYLMTRHSHIGLGTMSIPCPHPIQSFKPHNTVVHYVRNTIKWYNLYLQNIEQICIIVYTVLSLNRHLYNPIQLLVWTSINQC